MPSTRRLYYSLYPGIKDRPDLNPGFLPEINLNLPPGEISPHPGGSIVNARTPGWTSILSPQYPPVTGGLVGQGPGLPRPNLQNSPGQWRQWPSRRCSSGPPVPFPGLPCSRRGHLPPQSGIVAGKGRGPGSPAPPDVGHFDLDAGLLRFIRPLGPGLPGQVGNVGFRARRGGFWLMPI